jgi:predicted RNA-binding protein with RPS1 domain
MEGKWLLIAKLTTNYLKEKRGTLKESSMVKSKIQETLDTIGQIDFDIRWVQQKIAKQNYNSFKKSVEHQEKIQMMVLERLKERYNKQVDKLKIY